MVRGRDWTWGAQDSGVIGVVTKPLGLSGTVDVTWTGNGQTYTYSMGANGRYELYRLVGELQFSSHDPLCDIFDFWVQHDFPFENSFRIFLNLKDIVIAMAMCFVR